MRTRHDGVTDRELRVANEVLARLGPEMFDGQLLDTYTDRFHRGWMFYFPDTREVREATEHMTIWATEHGVELKVLYLDHSAMKARTLVFKISNPGVPANVAAFLVFKLCTDKTLTWRHRNPNFDPHTLFMEAS